SGALPYADSQFDYVVCLEGLEHIENPHQAIREFERILVPNGQLVVSVPNMLNVEERLKWLVYGYTSHFKPISDEHLLSRRGQSGDREQIALHINPIAYTELRFILQKYGFDLLGTYRDRRKSNQWMYWPVIALIRCVGFFTPPDRKRERW